MLQLDWMDNCGVYVIYKNWHDEVESCADLRYYLDMKKPSSVVVLSCNNSKSERFCASRAGRA